MRHGSSNCISLVALYLPSAYLSSCREQSPPARVPRHGQTQNPNRNEIRNPNHDEPRHPNRKTKPEQSPPACAPRHGGTRNPTVMKPETQTVVKPETPTVMKPEKQTLIRPESRAEARIPEQTQPAPATRQGEFQNPNRDPSTREFTPKPETRNPKPETRNPKHEPETRNPKPQTPNRAGGAKRRRAGGPSAGRRSPTSRTTGAPTFSQAHAIKATCAHSGAEPDLRPSHVLKLRPSLRLCAYSFSNRCVFRPKTHQFTPAIYVTDILSGACDQGHVCAFRCGAGPISTSLSVFFVSQI